MRTIHYILILIVLFLAACTSDESLSPTEPGNVTFHFTAGSEMNTRTVLNSSENLQHVEKVYLYIFSGTTDAATYVDSKELLWPKPGDVNYKTTQRSYSMTLAPGDYTFLAIGLDDKSGATYNLPLAIAAGNTLADAKATLASGKTKDDIAQSELFAGYAIAVVKQSDNAAVTIDLWRRVAGVMGWFKNVPSNISKIQVSLYTQQNKSGYLLQQEPESNLPYGDIRNPNNFKDYITDPISTIAEDKILVSIAVPAGTEATTVLSQGSYVLPAAAPAVGDGTEYTLLIELVALDGTISKTMRAKLKEDDDLYISPTSGGTGIIDTGGPFRFPIVANHFYGIGTALAPVDLDSGAGNEIVITVVPSWEVVEDLEWQ